MPDMTVNEAKEFFAEQDKAHYVVYDGSKFRLGDINGNYQDVPEGVRLFELVVRCEPGDVITRMKFEGKAFVATMDSGYWFFE